MHGLREAPPAVNGLWVGSGLTPIEQLSIRSFLAHGHAYRLHVYDEVEGVPNGACLVDAGAVLRRDRLFRSQGSPAHFSDWFRWALLAREGGCWADLDVVCLRPLGWPNGDQPLFGWQDAETINTAVLAFPAGHPLALTMLDRCDRARPVWPGTRRGEIVGAVEAGPPDPAAQPWGLVGGPYGFTAEVKRAGLEHAARPPACFYPIAFQAWETLLRPGSASIDEALPGATTVHLWNDRWRRQGVDKRASFPASSLLEQLKDRYLRGPS